MEMDEYFSTVFQDHDDIDNYSTTCSDVYALDGANHNPIHSRRPVDVDLTLDDLPSSPTELQEPLNVFDVVSNDVDLMLDDIPSSPTEVQEPLNVFDVAHNDEDNLVGMNVQNEEDAYTLYNEHAFKIGFSIRRCKQRTRVDKTICMKQYVCSHAGIKRKIAKEDKCFSKLDVRSDCPAFVQFNVDKSGTWVVTKHVKHHNHPLCPSDSSYLLRSHRKVSNTQLTYLKELQKSGVGVADGVRVLKNQSGGSPFVGFSLRDAYNALNISKAIEGTDSNTLITIFKNRQDNEKDFVFDFELDSDSRLCSLFWRDGRMRQDYELFGDLVVHDTTYRTNKYDMICGPFVGMNHHGSNVMFGCGFLLNERTESFEWLFRAFLRSMGGKHPITIMTDQSAAMSAAIANIFISTRHRLCVWHIGENSKKHIRSLRSKKGFVELFNQLMKYTETVAEFEFYWQKMLSTYQCDKNTWLLKLHNLREKWCPAFSKDFFSGSILSSQRSESTNNSISRKLSKTACLRDFYMCFIEVVSEWRSNENAEDIRCLQGKPSMVLSDSKLMLHAREVYTLEVFDMFEKQFLKGAQCHQVCVYADIANLKYHVWVDGVDTIRHEVIFDVNEVSIECTCKMFSEVGILCCHALRILNINCICVIPERYILKRWRKDVVAERTMDDNVLTDSLSKSSMASSLWRIQMTRKFQNLILASVDNSSARMKCEEIYQSGKCTIIDHVDPIYSDSVPTDLAASGTVQNPQSSSLKNKRNKRVKSILEKKCNQAKGKRKKAQSAEQHTKLVLQQMQVVNVGNDAYVVHPSSGGRSLEVVTINSYSTFGPFV